MTAISHLKYQPQDHFIHNWLVTSGDRIDANVQPYENAQIDGHTWTYHRCDDDHRISGTWAYTQIVPDLTAPFDATVTSNGNVQVYLNSEAVSGRDNSYRLDVKTGVNDLLVYFPAGSGTVRLSSDAFTVQIPTAVKRVDRREKFERVLYMASLERAVYSAGSAIILRWDEALDERCDVWAQLKHVNGRTYAESRQMVDADTREIGLKKASTLQDGEYYIQLSPQPGEFFNDMKISRNLPLRVVSTPHQTGLYGTDDNRREEALIYAAKHTENPIVTRMLNEWVERRIDTPVHHAPLYVTLLGIIDLINRNNLQSELPSQSSLTSLAMDVVSLLQDKSQHAVNCQRVIIHLQQYAEFGFNLTAHQVNLTVLSLILLIDYAEDDQIAELSAVVLDKLLFTLALNTYQGTVSQMFADHDLPPNGRTHPLSGVSRLLWGTGTWNTSLIGVLALATCENYQVPSIIQAIALDTNEPMLSVECHTPEKIQRTTYRTADYLLTSQQNKWQAILSPDAVVNVRCADHAWIKQHRDVLIAEQPREVYFPEWAFDETIQRNDWTCARVDDGYIALYQTDNVMICHMGRAADDGDFDAFVQKIGELPVEIGGSSVHMATLRGETLTVLAVQPEQDAQLPHYDSPYCRVEFGAEEMDIRFGEYVMRLNMSTVPSP